MGYDLISAFERIHPLVRQWASEVAEAELSGTYDSPSDRDVENIQNKPVPGFIPFTSGGVEVVISALLDYCDSEGSAPAVIQPYLDQAHKDAEDAWDEEHPEAPVSAIFADDSHDLREEFYEHERSYLEGTFFYKIRAIYLSTRDGGNESGEDEVLFCIGINTDFGYGRDTISWLKCYGANPHQTTWVWEATVKASDFTPGLIKQLARDARSALEAA